MRQAFQEVPRCTPCSSLCRSGRTSATGFWPRSPTMRRPPCGTSRGVCGSTSCSTPSTPTGSTSTRSTPTGPRLMPIRLPRTSRCGARQPTTASCRAVRSTPSPTCSSLTPPLSRHDHPHFPLTKGPLMSTIVTINPATGEQLASYPAMTNEQIDAILDVAVAAQTVWAAEDFKARGEVLRAAATVLRERDSELALLVTREMGKPLAEALAEVHKCAAGLDFYADHGPDFLADEIYQTSADRSWVSYEPVGVVLAVMPWNFPLWQVFRFAAPALMAGNAALLKHSPNTTGAALVIEEIFTQAGFPKGAFRTLLLGSKQVQAVIENPLVRA